MLFEYPLLFIAGFVGGMLNSIAGGGTFITFPAILLVGVPPISANATNTFAKFILFSLIGGIVGAWLLLQTPESLFREVIPWLLLFSTVLFVYGGRLNNWLRRVTSHHRYAPSIGKFLLFLTFLGVSVYGGFFNAGLGIIVLSYLTLAGYRDINAMNGLKLLTSSSVSLAAIALFIYENVIAWHEGAIVLLGTLTGGYIAAHVSRKVPQKYIRNIVIFVSIIITTYFFYDVYFTLDASD